MWMHVAAAAFVVVLAAAAWSDPETGDVAVFVVFSLIYIAYAASLEWLTGKAIRTSEQALSDIDNDLLFIRDVSRTTGRALAQLARHDPERAAELVLELKAAARSAEYRDWWSEQGDGATTGDGSDRIAELIDRARRRQKGDA